MFRFAAYLKTNLSLNNTFRVAHQRRGMFHNFFLCKIIKFNSVKFNVLERTMFLKTLILYSIYNFIIYDL